MSHHISFSIQIQIIIDTHNENTHTHFFQLPVTYLEWRTSSPSTSSIGHINVICLRSQKRSENEIYTGKKTGPRAITKKEEIISGFCLLFSILLSIKIAFVVCEEEG